MWSVCPVILYEHLKMTPLCSGVFGNLLLLSAAVHTVSGSSTSSKKPCGIQTIEKATEGSVTYRNIGIRLCQARCVEVGGCLRFEYNYETLICRLRLGESKRIKENERFIAFQKNHSDVPAGPCTDMSCSLGSRCIESRSGKAVCVKDEEIIFLSRYQQHKRDQKRKSGDNILLEACREGDLSRVQHILTEGHVDLNSREKEHGMTPVMLAARGGHSPLFDFLAKEGGNMSLVDNKGNNILHIACHGAHLAIVKYIMSLHIVDINSRGQYGRTSAMTAAYKGKSEVFKFLLGKGANVSLVDEAGDNILHISCRGGHVRMVKYIISLNIVDINSRGQYGRTSAMTAAYKGKSEVFKFLLGKGANMSLVDNKGNNILHIACHGGHLAIVKYIMSLHIVDINSRGQYLSTPAMTAAYKGKSEVFKFLLGKGANVSLVDEAGDNILHISCRGGHVRMVKYIISLNIVDINSRGQYGRTPLMVAALFSHREAFELVLDKGGDTSLVDKRGVNILHLACIGGNVAIVKYILSQNFVDINSRGKVGRTPVMVAAAQGHIDLCYLLISKGSDLSVVDDNGCTILHVACYHGQFEIVMYILSQQVVDINDRDKNGNTAAMIAKEKKHKAVYLLLVSQG